MWRDGVHPALPVRPRHAELASLFHLVLLVLFMPTRTCSTQLVTAPASARHRRVLPRNPLTALKDCRENKGQPIHLVSTYCDVQSVPYENAA